MQGEVTWPYLPLLTMRKRIILFVGFLSFSAGVVFADTEIDTDFMQNVKSTAESLDSDIAQKNVQAAAADAKELEESFKHVEVFFAKKGDAADAVGFAQKTGGIASDIEKSVTANDFDAAENSVTSLMHSCKTCHAIYKKD
jgi:hypothetical protein